MNHPFKAKSRAFEQHITEQVQTRRIPELSDGMFRLADVDELSAERTGYSNYSYWRSTFQAFLHNRTAVIMLIVLVVLLVFTFVQPLLPGQYGANTINNDPVTGIQLQNQSPSLTTVYTTLPAGTGLTGKRLDDQWYIVSNVLANLKARQVFTITEYGDEWCGIEYKGLTGYVKNNFQTKLKLPEDPKAVPYESRSSFNIQVYQEPVDLTNKGGMLYAKAEDIRELGEGQVETVRSCELRTIPSGYPFIFGTNNIGQDLWARVWSGTRTSLWIGFVVGFFEALIGILVGILWGYVRALDRLITEIYNILDNIPNTIILILISYIMRPGITTLIFAMSLTRWLGMARFI